MLVDDNPHDNFFHERLIKKDNKADNIISMESAQKALDYLKEAEHQGSKPRPNIIFLDVNMPGMKGWDFIDELIKLDIEYLEEIIVTMLTSTEDPEEKKKAEKFNFISGFKTKPLTSEILSEIVDKWVS